MKYSDLHKIRQIAAIMACLFFCVSVANAEPLIIGKVSDNPKKHYHYLKPMVDYVAMQMEDLGISEGRVVMARDNQQMLDYLQQGKVDWVTETPLSASLFHKQAGAEYLLRKWKKGVSSYHSVIFTRNNSNIQSLQDLKGKTIAFEDPGSSSAYYIPAAILLKQGLSLHPLINPREKPPADKLGYAFSGEEINTVTWVHMGLVDLGTLSNLGWENDEQAPPQYRDNMKIIHRSRPFPRALELVRKDLPLPVKQRLKTILLNIHRQPGAVHILRAYQRTKKFDELTDAIRADMEEAAELTRIVDSRLE